MAANLRNIVIDKDGEEIQVLVNAKETLGPSASGKTILVATTGGAFLIPNTDIYANITFYKKRKQS